MAELAGQCLNHDAYSTYFILSPVSEIAPISDKTLETPEPQEGPLTLGGGEVWSIGQYT